MNNSSPHLFSIAQLSDLLYRNASSLKEPQFHSAARDGTALQASNPNHAGSSSFESGAWLELCATTAANNSLQFTFQI